ncbi:hypothetical protein EZS27_014684 [termite gut metagenome]|uniref:Uncharacterized protein n=1 Tax=termite gut metagenome TaxID=433724 RepID=A0A5J4RTA1_9ZZZZ
MNITKVRYISIHSHKYLSNLISQIANRLIEITLVKVACIHRCNGKWIERPEVVNLLL